MKQVNVKGESVYTGDEKKEIARIYRQNEYLNRIVAPYLDEIFEYCVDPLVLDIGCADGSNILFRLKNRNYNALLGIDKNQIKIKMANDLFSSEKNTFVCCDINSDDLRTILSGYLKKKKRIGFDLIHISSVLLHIENPILLLQNLHAFLSEKGHIFIQDEDDGVNMVYPYDESFENCFYVWNHSIESGDRFMGRKIPFFLSKSNYSDIKILSSNITSLDFNGEMKDCLWDLYFNSDLWVANSPSFYDTPDAYERFLNYKKKHSELKKAYMNGNYFIMLGFFFIIAQK